MKATIYLLSFLTIIACFYSIHICYTLWFKQKMDTPIIAAFGASAVLAFSGETNSTYPVKNIFLSSIAASLIGVFLVQYPLSKTILSTIALCICVPLMQVTNLKYPPAGAMAIIPILSDNSQVKDLGYMFAFSPVLIGVSFIYTFSKIQLFITLKIQTLWQVQKQ